MELLKLQTRLALQLLDEVAVPVQALIEALQGPAPGDRREPLAPLAIPLHHLPQRQGAPAQVGREPRTAGKGRVRTRQAALVGATAPI